MPPAALCWETRNVTIPAYLQGLSARIATPLEPWTFCVGGCGRGSLVVAWLIAGGFAFPVNRWLLARGKRQATMHEYHHAH
jgi:hypothetical protein